MCNSKRGLPLKKTEERLCTPTWKFKFLMLLYRKDRIKNIKKIPKKIIIKKIWVGVMIQILKNTTND